MVAQLTSIRVTLEHHSMALSLFTRCEFEEDGRYSGIDRFHFQSYGKVGSPIPMLTFPQPTMATAKTKTIWAKKMTPRRITILCFLDAYYKVRLIIPPHTMIRMLAVTP
jgi:hypothetical protein